MLTRALRTNIGGFRDLAKQLLIWSKNSKAEFCTSFDFDKESDNFFQKKTYRHNQYDNWNNNRRNHYPRKKYGFSDGRNNRRDSFNIKGLFLKNEDVVFNENLTEHVKDFYKPHPDVLNRPPEEVNEFRKKNKIQVEAFGSKKDFPPIFSFSELDLPENLSNVFSKLNYTQPTAVQSQTWPIALCGQNMVGISRTGSGKTLGFLLPAILHIKHQPPIDRGEGPIVLIMAPTRELGQQILDVSIPLARSFNFRVASLFGGASKQEQVRNLFQGCHLCVATPGRLNDVLNDNFVKLNRCTYLVLDEADNLLEMGFHRQIKSVFHYCRRDKQVLMWSATWPKEVRYLANTFLKDYVLVKFGSDELEANPNIRQNIHFCEESEKFSLLLDLLRKINETDDNKTLIFCSTKLKADKIKYMLWREGFKLAVIHGDKSQRERDFALQDFRRGHVKILVGTGVVGRGIDIDDIRYVINYDFPMFVKDYVHIIGRTARSENTGTAHTFFTYEDRPKAAELIKVLRQANQPVDPNLEKMALPEPRRYRSYRNLNAPDF